MRQLVAPQFDKAVAMAANIGARPALATDGADVTAWYSSNASGPFAMVLLDGSVAANLTAPAGGGNAVELWGLFPFATGAIVISGVNYQWFKIGVLNQGNLIAVVDDSHGYAEEFKHVGVARRLAVAATVSAGNATATFVPLETNDL